MPETTQKIKEIDLRDLFEVLKKNLVFIIIAAFVATAGSYVWTKTTYVPAYRSTATLYLLRQYNVDGQLTTQALSNELSLSAYLVNDCTYILKMPTTMNEVIKELKLNTTAGALRGSISTNNPQNTRILEVSVVAASPELAKEIVDAVCVTGAEKIAKTIGINQINISEYGTLSTSPCNTPKTSRHIIAGIIAAAAVYLIFFVISLLDDGIKSDSDVENYLGLSVLGWIPDTDAPHSKRYGYGYGYGQSRVKGKKKRAETETAAVDAGNGRNNGNA